MRFAFIYALCGLGTFAGLTSYGGPTPVPGVANRVMTALIWPAYVTNLVVYNQLQQSGTGGHSYGGGDNYKN